MGEAVSPEDKHFEFIHQSQTTKTCCYQLPESLRDEDDLIFFLGEDADEGEGLSCLDLLPAFDVVCCK